MRRGASRASRCLLELGRIRKSLSVGLPTRQSHDRNFGGPRIFGLRAPPFPVPRRSAVTTTRRRSLVLRENDGHFIGSSRPPARLTSGSVSRGAKCTETPTASSKRSISSSAPRRSSSQNGAASEGSSGNSTGGTAEKWDRTDSFKMKRKIAREETFKFEEGAATVQGRKEILTELSNIVETEPRSVRFSFLLMLDGQ